MISVAVQKGNMVFVYDEKNHVIKTESGTLQGYTSNTFTVQKGYMLYTYSEKGSVISTRHV